MGTVRRGDPKGAPIALESASIGSRIVQIEVALEGNGEPSLVAMFPNEARRSGEYWRGLAFKPTVNGTWPVVVTATDALGRTGTTRCVPGITVGF